MPSLRGGSAGRSARQATLSGGSGPVEASGRPQRRRVARWLTLRLLGPLSALGWLCSGQAAELDEVQLALLKQYNLPVHWDNLEGVPQWVCGTEPRHDYKLGLHTVCLPPGGSVVLKVPPRSMVRAFCPGRRLAADDVELWISNGSGLYCRAEPMVSADGTSLVAAAADPHTTLARVTRPAHHDRPLVLAVFTSRRELPGEIAPYRCLLCDGGPVVKLRRRDEAKGRPYSYLTPGRPASMPIIGPLRLAVRTRLCYPAAEAQRQQAYRIRVVLDGRLHKILDYQSSAQHRTATFVEGRRQMLGRETAAYVEVPGGSHRLELDATASLYVRVLAQQQPDYLLPQLNEPAFSPEHARAVKRPLDGLISGWDVKPEDFARLALTGAEMVGTQERIAVRSARDNGYRQGGLRGAMLMRLAAARRPDEPKVRAVADKLRRLNTYYRDLLPAEKRQPGRQRFAWFYNRRLRDPGEPVDELSIAAGHVDDAIDELSGAFFVGIGGPRPQANLYRTALYHTAAETGPTLLRIVVDRRSVRDRARLAVQFDDRDPIELELAGGEPLCGGDFVPSLVEAALTALHWRHGDVDGGTLGGPFGRDRPPAELLSAATAELVLPAGVREVRLWSLGPRTQRPRVALQYRASKPYRLGQSEYLEMQRRVGGDGRQVFQAMLTGRRPPPEVDRYCIRELQNHWLPLARLMRAHRHVLLTTAGSPPRPQPAINPPDQGALDQGAIDALTTQADRLARDGHWLPLLEVYSRLLPHTTGGHRREVLLGQATALERLGEAYLAQRQLRGTFLFDPDTIARQEALDRLQLLYARTGELDSLEQLASVAALQSPTPDRLSDLAEVLLDGGRYQFALTAALAVPPPQRPVHVVVRAAYRLRWWDVFGRAVDQLPDARQRHYWQAYRCLGLGLYAEAVEHFRHAGEPGMRLAEHLQQGLDVQRRLRDPDLAARAKAVFDWERWWAEHPGPYAWREHGPAVADYCGAESVYGISRDTYAQHYLARPSRPLRLSVLGPLRLKLEVRPIHPKDSHDPLDDWLLVRTAGRLRPVAINGNRPSGGLRIVGDDQRLPGRKVQTRLDLGPGLHEVELFGESTDLLVRVFARRPDVALSVLPELNRDTLAAVLAGTYTSVQETSPPCSPRFSVQLLPAGCGGQAVSGPPLTQLGTPPPARFAGCRELDERTAARLAQRTGQSPPARPDSLEDWSPPPPDPDEALRQRMTMLVRRAETDPSQARRCLVLGKELFAKHPQAAGMAELHARLARLSSWKQLQGITGSAGVRSVEVSHWQPESPAVRARKSLLEAVAPGENILLGHQDLVISLEDTRPTALELSVSLAALGYIPLSPAKIVYQQDQQPPGRVSLSADSPRGTMKVAVPAGSHHVRLWIERPVANQYVRVRAVEPAGGSVLVRQTQRFYHVATHREPVKLTVNGPSWLRIDRLQRGVTLTSYLAVKEDTRRIELRPQPGEQEALLRLFECVADPGKRAAAPAWVKVDPLPVPPPLIGTFSPPGEQPIERPIERPVELPAASSIASLEGPLLLADVDDDYPLGGQEDGTWSAAVGLFHRRELEEGPDGREPDEFVEVAATHRYFDPWRRDYWQTDLLLRTRQRSGPTFGLREHLQHRPDWLPVTFHLDGGAMLQRPADAVLPEAGGTEWSVWLRGRAVQYRQLTPECYHLPSVSLFGRLLSMEENLYRAGRVDQDVFTGYKADHRGGYVLSDTLVYRPWLDTKCWVRPALVSNEDFGLDRLSLRTGWSQALGPLEVEAAYRAAWFLDDAHRRGGSTQHLLYVDLLADGWWRPWRRAEVGVGVIYDLSQGSTSAKLTLTCYLDNGRAYRDVRSGELDFGDLRRRRAPQQVARRWSTW